MFAQLAWRLRCFMMVAELKVASHEDSSIHEYFYSHRTETEVWANSGSTTGSRSWLAGTCSHNKGLEARLNDSVTDAVDLESQVTLFVIRNGEGMEGVVDVDDNRPVDACEAKVDGETDFDRAISPGLNDARQFSCNSTRSSSTNGFPRKPFNCWFDML